MKNYTVVPGDSLSRIILREYAIDSPIWSAELMDCMIKYLSILNNRNINLYDNLYSNDITDPDNLKPGQILSIPDSLNEAAADPRFKTINANACGALLNTADTFTPDQKNNKYLWWLGYGLLAVGTIYFLTKKKKRK
jgi:hypothetical protein